MALEVGKTYLINHSRKGTFVAKIKSNDDTWTTGRIVEGQTEALMQCNVQDVGEDVTFRTRLVNSYQEQQ